MTDAQSDAQSDAGRWTEVGTTKELRRRRSLVIDGPDGDVAVFWNDGVPAAMANICVHRDRELARGAILNGRVVCPGHQWAFDVTTGYCAERERTQPIYEARIIDDVVLVDTSAPVNRDQLEETAPSDAAAAEGPPSE